MRSAAVRCIGVFLSKVPFSYLENHISMILVNREINLDQLSYSDSRLKLVTLAILKLNWEIEQDAQIGIFCSGTSYRMTITGVARAVVMDMFEAPATTSRNRIEALVEKTDQSQHQHSERAMSSALDLIAATLLVMCPFKIQNKDNIIRNSSTKKSLSSEFIESVLTDGSGIVRVGYAMQEEIHRRATERCMLSLNSDSNLSSIADSLLTVDNDTVNIEKSVPLSRQTSLTLAVPSSETIDSLYTTAETNTTRSEVTVHSTSSLIFFPASSNGNLPVSPISYINNDGNESADGVDSDMDRSKLSALKRNQNRNFSRRQTHVIGLGLCLGAGIARASTPDFFTSTDHDTSEQITGIAGSRSHGSSRSKAEFSKLLVQRASHSKVANDTKKIHCRAVPTKSRVSGANEFSNIHVIVNHTSTFIRPNRHDPGTTDDGDVAVSDADEFDEEAEMHIGFDADSEDDAYTVHDGSDSPDFLALAGETFLQGLGARTAEERTRSHKHRYSNHSSGRSERSKSVQCPQTPLAVAIYGVDGQRTQELVIQGHNSERTSKRSTIGVGGPTRGSRILGVSPSLSGNLSPSLSGDSLESSSTYGYPVVVHPESRAADFPPLILRTKGKDRDETYSNSLTDHASIICPSNMRKMRVMHSPRSTTATSVSVSLAASSSSSRCSSPKGSNRTVASTGISGGKAEVKIRNRVRVTKEQDDDSQSQQQEQRYEEELKSGLKNYQLAGVSYIPSTVYIR